MENYYIGWDVGAWKCTKGKGDSCDALVVLDDSQIIGHHRANLGDSLSQLQKTPAKDRPAYLINEWFSLCGVKGKRYSEDHHYYIAIDTPLGWPNDFKGLLDLKLPTDWGYQHGSANIANSLLFRYTEREKLKSGLSVIVDSIGSQSTKGMFLLQMLDATDAQWGVWKVGNITLFETYPKACLVRAGFVSWMRELKLIQNLTQTFSVVVKKKPKRYGSVTVIAEDSFDAGVCSCVAKAFAERSPKLVCPTPHDPQIYKPEGWIFYPDQDSTADQRIADGHKKVTCCEGY